MSKYVVHTDGFTADDIEAACLNDAIAEAFEGEGLGKIVDEASLHRLFQRYVNDGGFCRIDEDGVEVVTIGEI